MDPLIAPIGSAVLITAATIGSVFGAGSTGDAAAEKVADVVRGILGNWAADGFEAGTLKLLERAADQSIDPATGLPRNHDIQLASADAMRGAAIATLLELGRTLKPKAPWLPALRDFIFTQRKLGKEPLINAFQRDDLAAVARLRSEIESPRFKEWHDSLLLNELEIRSCFAGGTCSLRPVLRHRFAEWALRHLEQDDVQQVLRELMEEGWSGGGSQVLRFEDIYCLHFREFLKHRAEIFRIVMADTLMATDQRLSSLGGALDAHIGAVHGLFEQHQALIDQVSQGQRELGQGLGEVLTTLSVLHGHRQSDAKGTTQVLHALHDHTQRLSNAFSRLELSLFGLPLVRPEATAPPPLSQGDLWVIQAKHRAVPLVGRDETMQSLWQWLHQPASTSVRLLVGPAGAGKTRLAYELIWRLAVERGEEWQAGRIESAQLRRLVEHTDPGQWCWDKPTLLVIDYARAATEGLQVLLKELARRSAVAGGFRFRLLLLERTPSATADWVDELKRAESSDGGYPAGQLFDPPAAQELPPIKAIALRRELFAAALAALARSSTPLRTPEPDERPDFDLMLQQSHWGDPLVPAMAALVAHAHRDVMQALTLSRTDMAQHLARAEGARLCRFAALRDAAPQSRLLLHVAAVAVLCGGPRLTECMEAAKHEASRLGLHWAAGPGDLSGHLHAAWRASDNRLAELQPDIVAEAFVLQHLNGGVLAGEQAIATVRAAASGHESAVAGLVLRAFHNFQATHSGPLAAWAKALVETGLAERQPALIAALDDAMPRSTTALREVALALALARFEASAVPPDAEDSGALAERARLTNNLAFRYAELGRRNEALAPAEEAVRVYEVLAERHPGGYRPELAMSLNNLASFYAELGRRDEALAPAEEAVRLYEALAKRHLDAYRPALASSLHNLANRYAELGRRDEALAPAEEAVRLRRALAERHPDAYRPDLAMSLNNLGSLYAELGRRDEALASAEEAVRLYEALAERHPDAYRPALAMSLNNLASFYGKLGRRDEALAPAEEAVRLYEALAERHPDAYWPDLATSLHNLAIHYAELGRCDEALSLAEEAVRLYEALAKRHPDAYRPALASSLHSLATRYAELGRRDEALAPAEEAVRLRRALAERHADAYRPDLASSLHSLATRYAELGRRDEALAPAEEAVRLRRALAERHADAYRPDLANSLNNLAIRYAELSRRDDALAPAEEAVRLRRALAERYPDACRPDLARSLNNLASLYAELGRRDEALAPAKEALRLRRALAERHPDAYRPDLAMSLNNLASLYAELGRRDEALAPAEEAVRLRRALAERHPDAYRPDLVMSLGNLAIRYAELGRRDEAITAALELCRAADRPIEAVKSINAAREAASFLPAHKWLTSFGWQTLQVSQVDWARRVVGLAEGSGAAGRAQFHLAPLSFLPGAGLLVVGDPRQAAPYLCYIALDEGPAFRLDGSSLRLHLLNALLAPQLGSDQQLIDYARFFCFFVSTAEQQRFIVVEPGAVLPWQHDADASVRVAAEEKLEHPRVLAAAPSGLRLMTATMLYGKSLYRVRLAIATQALAAAAADGQEPTDWRLGEVAMLGEDKVTEELPLR